MGRPLEYTREVRGETTDVVLRPHGWLRLIPAAFLLVWISGWAVFETGCLAFILYLLRALIAPNALSSLVPPAKMGPGGVVVIVGLLVPLGLFTALWTFGGVSALRDLVRLFASEDRISFGPDGIACEQRVAFRVQTVQLTRSRVLDLRTARNALVADVEGEKERILTQLASIKALRDLRDEMRRVLGIDTPEANRRRVAKDEAAPPEGYVVEPDPGGGVTLELGPAARRRHARILFAIGATLLALAAWVVLEESKRAEVSPSTQNAAVVVAVIASPFLLLAFFARFGRVTLTARDGMIRRTRHLLHWRFERTVQSPALVLEHDTDSDGDDRYALVAKGGDGQKDLHIAGDINADRTLIHLGRYLAAKAHTELR